MPATTPRKLTTKRKKASAKTKTTSKRKAAPRTKRICSVASSSTRVLLDELSPAAGFDPNTDYLSPMKESSLAWTLTLKYPDGKPAVGVRVTASRRAETLTGANWRTVDGLVARWPASSAQKLRERIEQELVRLGARLDKNSAVTNANGEVTFTIGAWHVCGDESLCGSDRITLSWPDGSLPIVLRCGVPGMVAVPNEPSNGLIVTGNNYFVRPVLVEILRAIGQAWRDTTGKPSGMPDHFAVTDASIRWGGLKPPHLTHRFGAAVDVRPISTDGRPTSVGAANYSRDGTKVLIDYFHQAGATEIRFADNLPYVTAVDATHADHMHVSWLTNPAEPWVLPPAIARLTPKPAAMSA